MTTLTARARAAARTSAAVDLLEQAKRLGAGALHPEEERELDDLTARVRGLDALLRDPSGPA